MSTNLFFNNFPKHVTSEQLLVEDLVIEAMQINGHDVFYMPRTSQDVVDYLYGEDPLKKYVSAYPIEMYIENVTGMEGEGDFISRFGLEIRDEMSLLVSRRRFAANIPLQRPREGDLIYVPLVQNFFEITFVEHENNQAMFYTLGKGRGGNIYVYALKLKQFLFSNEIIETGIEEIDGQIRDEYPRVQLLINNVTGKFLNDEVIYQGASYNTRTAEALVYDFIPSTEINVYRTRGVFKAGLVYGRTSGAVGTILTASDTANMDNIFEDIVDNDRVETESNVFTMFDETNPFGHS